MKRLILKSIFAGVASCAGLGWLWYTYGWPTALAIFVLFYSNNVSWHVVLELAARRKI